MRISDWSSDVCSSDLMQQRPAEDASAGGRNRDMENASYIALSRQLSLRRELDVVAHNMANMNTPAYKAERVVFVEYLSQPTPQDRLIAEERRVGKGGISTGKIRWGAANSKKQK